ncbi:MAG: EFR1 family ferrodoxin [Candidatus Hodarchaeales archaeon]
MKIAIIYFSGTGITEGYAKIITDVLKQKGEMVSLHNITSINDRKTGVDFGIFDAIIFGFPVYGGRLPTVAEAWLNTLEVNKQCSMYFTYGGRELEWAYQTGYYLLSKASFKVVLAAEFVGKHSFNVAQGWDLASERPNSHDKSIAIEFALESLKRFQSDDVKWEYNLEDFDYQPRVTKEYHGPFAVFFPYKTQDCIMCYRCETECPTGAFDLSQGKGKNGVCIRCMHCVTICPDNVIEVGDATELFQKFKTTHDLTLENVKKKSSKIVY